MSEENVELIRKAFEVWFRGDLDALEAYWDPDIVWDLTHFHDWPESDYQGVEGVRRFLTEWLQVWGDFEMGIDEIVAAPDGRVVSLISQRGKGRQSGLPMTMEMAQIATIRNGKVTRLENYENRAEALEDSGLSE